MKKAIAVTPVLILFIIQAISPTSLPARTEDRESKHQAAVKNVVLMISDGMGYSHIDAAGIYRFGEKGKQIYEKFPFQCAVSTYCYGGAYDPQRAWTDFQYVKIFPTDSAAAATALSTGAKTRKRALGVDPVGRPLKHLVERAEDLGKATGIVTSVPISHATPAGFVVHNFYRYDFRGIAYEMICDSEVDVIMGAGHPMFDNDGRPAEGEDFPRRYRYVGGKGLWLALVAGGIGGDADRDGVPDPWTLIQTREEFARLAVGPTPKRVLGLVQVRETLQDRRSAKDNDKSDDEPYQVPFIESVPTLAEMTEAAINVLDNDPDGFFLMVEGGAVDWSSEDNVSGRTIEEQIDFDKAVEAVVRWVEGNSGWDETLLLVTSDHEAGYLTGPGTRPELKPLENRGRCRMPGMEWHSPTHTNSLVPLYAKGRGIELLKERADESDPVRGRYLDNTEIAKVLFEVWKYLLTSKYALSSELRY